MKLVRFNEDSIGVVVGTQVHDVTAIVQPGLAPSWPPMAMIRLIAEFGALRPRIEAALGTVPTIPLDQTSLKTPIPWPNKLMAYPVNYVDHANEMNSVGFANVQGYFLKANSSLIGPRDQIVLPNLPGREVHHECELAVIIGRGGRAIPRERALEHVFGYACLMDIVVRGKEERVFRKSYDTFTPVGPWIVTADEVVNPDSLAMRLWVNGELRQSANTCDLIVGLAEMIEIASSASTLVPGDIIATGTPAGVGPIRDGDQVTIEIDQVGRMTLPVIAGTLGGSRVFLKD